MRDQGLRAAAIMSKVDALWVEHDTMLVDKMNERHG
jgi:hypothetical protein